MRVAVIHNPTAPVPIDLSPTSLPRAVQVATQILGSNKARSFVTKLVKEENVAGWRDGSLAVDDLAVHVTTLIYYALIRDGALMASQNFIKCVRFRHNLQYC